MRKVVVIIQARMGSTRLPGKVLMPLADNTALFHVLTRCRTIEGVTEVCCAIPEDKANDLVEEEARNCGVLIFRGQEQDVLNRYYEAAKAYQADIVMRVTSDCPLIDPQICHKILELFLKEQLDYAANNMPPSWPHGLDCEIFSFNALEQASRNAKKPDEREHVTPWIRHNSHLSKSNYSSENSELAQHRWTLDYPEDYEFFKSVFKLNQQYKTPLYMNDVLKILQMHPEVSALNKKYCDHSRVQHIA